MAVMPVVRYMLLCDDWRVDPANDRRVTIIGLVSNVRSRESPPYLFVYPELCVVLILTDGYGEGRGQIVCVNEDDGRRIFGTPGRAIRFGPDPTEVLGVSFRVQDCRFPRAGMYSFQFRYDGELVESRFLRAR